MSARSRASRARRTEKYSVPRSVRALAPHAGGVDEAATVPSGVSTTVSIASLVVPGSVVDDRPLVADQPVEQGRLADVGPTATSDATASGIVPRPWLGKPSWPVITMLGVLVSDPPTGRLADAGQSHQIVEEVAGHPARGGR